MRPHRFMVAMIATLLGLGAALAAYASGSITYTYDALGRVTTVTYSNGAVITYTYDAAGNRTQTVTSGSP